MSTETITFHTRVDGSLATVTIFINDITNFGVSYSPCYRKDGTFKKWLKFGFIETNHRRYACSYHYVQGIKSFSLKGRYQVSEKRKLMEIKISTGGYFLGERTATNWIFQMSDS